MATINGGSISVDSATKAHLEQSLKSAENDKSQTVRLKTTKNGTIEVVVDKGTSGNIFSRIVNKIFFQKRNAINQAVAFAWLNQFAKTGSNGASVTQKSIDKSLADRSVVTVNQALQMLAKGSVIDALHSTPQDSLQDIAHKLPLYAEAGASGNNIAKENLSKLTEQLQARPADPVSLQALSNMVKDPALEQNPALKQTVSEAWYKIAQNLVIQGDAIAIKTLLTDTDDAETITHLKAPLNGMAKRRELTPQGMQAYNEILKREAWVVGTNTAKEGSSAEQIKSTLESTKFSSRPKLNAELKTIAQEAATDHLRSQTPELPDLSDLADYFGEELPHGDSPEFLQKFTEGVQQMVSAGTLTISDLEYMARRIGDVGSLHSDPPSLQQLAESTSAEIRGDKGEDAAPLTNAQYFAVLKQQTTVQLQNTTYSPVKGHFKDMQSPAATNVAVAIPQEDGTLAPAQQGQIHANHIPFPEKNSAIATQYPTKGDAGRATFWRMAQQQGTNLIVDLTQPADLKKGAGLELYYPTEVGVPEEYDGVRVTLTEQTDGYNNYEVTDTLTGETSHTYRYHYNNWVDHGDANIEDIAALANMVSHESFDNTVIHCRAGVGRTATVYCAARLMNMMRSGEITPANKDEVINNMIMEMRTARGAAAVQTAPQRQMLSDLVNHWHTNGV